MARPERLIQLINLLKDRPVVTVREMSQVCGVSDRTIYRDLRTLKRMNIPTYYDGGYRLDRDRDFPLADLGTNELELIRYSLRNNPLVNYIFFRDKFNLIEKKIQDRARGKPGQDNKNLFLLEKLDDKVASVAGSDILNRFTRAIVTNHKVMIRLKGIDPTWRLFLPIAIKVTRSGPFLIVTSEPNESPVEVAVREIADLAVSKERKGKSRATRAQRKNGGAKKTG